MTVLVDATAQVSLAKKQSGVRYVLYAENLSREEVTNILQNAAAPDQRAPQAGKAFDHMLMREMGKDDRDNLAKLMRVNPKVLDPTKIAGADLKLLIDAIPDPGGKKADVVKGPERLAVLLPFGLETNLAQSKELRQFLKGQGLRAGTLQMVILIHESGERATLAP